MSASLEGVKKSIASLGTGLKVLGAAFAVKEIGEFVKSNLEFVASIGVAAKQIGVTSTQLQVYRFAANQAGVSQESLEIGLRKLTLSSGRAAAGSTAQTKAFQALGLETKNVDGSSVSTGKRLSELADKLSHTSDAGKRAAIEVALFGKAGQQMDPILRKGSASLEELGKQAQKAGLIIEDNLIEQAHKASVEIAVLDAQLKISVAKEVAANATAIYGLAGALINLTIAGLGYAAAYPRIAGALAGAIAGAKFGPLGVIVGAIGGEAIGTEAAHESTDIKIRTSEMRRANAEYKGALAVNLRAPSAQAQARVDLTRRIVGQESQKLKDAIGSRQGAEDQANPKGFKIPDFLAPHVHTPHAKKGPADHTNEHLKQYQDQSDNLDRQILQAKKANIFDVQEIARINREEVAVETDKLLKDLTIDAAKNPILAAHKDELAAKIKAIAAEKLTTIHREKADRLAFELVDLQLSANDNQKTLLRAQEQLAVTAKERNRIQTNILRLEREDEELKLRDIIAHSHDATAQRIAQDRLDSLPGVFAARQAGVDRSTEGPGKAYLRSVTLSKDQLKESIDNIKVSGLQNLNEGITQAILGAKSLGAVFKNVANSIIADLLRIAVQKYITNAIASALFGGQKPGGSVGGQAGGILNGLFSVISKGKTIPAHANGTLSTAPGFALVGERGPELVRFSGGQQVIPNHLLGGGGGGNTYHFSGNLMTPEFWAQIHAGHVASADAGANLGIARSAYRQGRRVA